MSPRVTAAVVLGLLLVGLAVSAAVTVPWRQPAVPSRSAQAAAERELPADQVARGKRFHAALRPGTYGSLLVGLIVVVLLGLTPLGARLVELVGRPFGGHWLAQAVLGGLVVVFAGQALTLPFAAWRRVVLLRYDLSTQSWAGWLLDVGKSVLVSAVLGAIVLAGFYAVARAAPRWWWAWTAAGAAALMVLLAFVFPVLIEPVFNKFTPMPDTPLRRDLIAMADRDGVPVRDVLVADASRRTRMVNAYVSGLGPTRRIVVYDTLVDSAPPAEVESVVAHELGHAEQGDVLTSTLLGAFGAAAGVCALYLLGGWSGLLRRAGVDDLTDPRSVALLGAVIAVAGLLTLPLQSYVSRRVEARADAHALALTADPDTFAGMQRRLALRNLSDVRPNPVEYWLFASHPSTVERIAAAREYQRAGR